MCKKLIYLISFVFVLSVAGNASADLVAHWPLDEGSGTTAIDLSGNGHDGTIGGTANWVAGQIGLALDFDGSTTYIDMDDEVVRGTWSLSMWIRPRDIPYTSADQDFYAVMHTDAWSTGAMHLHLRQTTSLLNADFNSGPDVTSTTVLQENEWYHAVVTVTDEGGGASQMYLNGVLEAEGSGGSGGDFLGPLNFGSWNNAGRNYHGLMDDIRIYDHILSEVEIMGAMSGEIWPYAYGPNPEDGAMYLDTWVNLIWKPGGFAVSHDVYLGDNFDDVDAGAEGTFLGNQATTKLIVGFPGFAYPDGLVPGTTYYWRIDEVNDADPNSPWKGDVWSFTVPPRTAYDPNPADGAKFVDPNVELSWTRGFGAKTHTVYFGNNFDDVNNAVVGIPQAETTYIPGTLELEKVYYWRIDEFDGAATYKGNVWSFTTTKAGGGIKAEYFNNTTLSGEPVLTRLDPEIDFDWGNAEVAGENSPDAIINVNNFSARWSGDLEVDLTDTYTFHITANNGFRLWVDGRPIIDYWDNPTTSSRESDPIELAGGNTYSIRMEYFEGEDAAIAQLFWESSTREQQIIPSGALQLPLKAGGADPYNGATDVKQTIILSWRQGDNAASHQVYFGSDEEAVHNADTASPEYKGTKALGSESYDPGKLSWDTTYYWRVDEVEADGTIQKGNVWSFTRANFILVDDFEDYNDYPPDEIFSTWIDGWEVPTNGSLAGHADPPFAETGIVHGGSQSMPLYYDNNFMYSEAIMTLVSVRDWTEEGVGVLSLWFRGNLNNAAERMYVALNGSAVVYHDNPDAALIEEWTEWTIDLQEFTAQGVNLANVNTISIGFGDKNNLQAGGSGMVFFDDIRLYRPAPEPEPAP